MQNNKKELCILRKELSIFRQLFWTFFEFVSWELDGKVGILWTETRNKARAKEES